MPIEFINADLEIISREDLEPIKLAFDQHQYHFAVMYCGETHPGIYLASFEVHPDEDRDDQSAQDKIHAFCKSISEFGGLSRELWTRATRRVIDLGYQSDDQCSPFNDLLSGDTLGLMNSLNIELALTIYPKTIKKQNKAEMATPRKPSD